MAGFISKVAFFLVLVAVGAYALPSPQGYGGYGSGYGGQSFGVQGFGTNFGRPSGFGGNFGGNSGFGRRPGNSFGGSFGGNSGFGRQPVNFGSNFGVSSGRRPSGYGK